MSEEGRFARTEGALRREVGLVAGTLVCVNAMIGTGIFKKSAQIAREVGSIEALILVWFLGGMIALAGALSLAELAAAIPRTGGLYEYCRRAWGDTTAFVLGFTRLVLLIPSALGSFAKLAAEACTAFFGLPADDETLDAISIAVIVACCATNLLGVRLSSLQQGLLTSLKYLGVLGLALAGLFLVPYGDAPPAPPIQTLPELEIASSTTLSGIFAALVAVMWAYDGWSDISTLGGEVREPSRNLPRALTMGTLATMALYVAMNFAYARVLGFEAIARSTVGEHMVAGNLATALFGADGLRALAGLVFLSCVGASMSTLLTGPRVLVAMAADGAFFEFIGRVDPRSGVPRVAVLVGALLGVVYVKFQSFEQLTDAFVVGLFPFYMLGVAAVLKLRQTEPELPRPFRVPLHPLPEIIFLVGAAATMLGALRDVTLGTAYALMLTLTAIPIAWLRKWWMRRARPL